MKRATMVSKIRRCLMSSRGYSGYTTIANDVLKIVEAHSGYLKYEWELPEKRKPKRGVGKC